VFCPFHSNAEWRQLAKSAPDDYAKAVVFDTEARQLREKHSENMNAVPYLHRSLKPLIEVDFRNDVDRGQLTFDWQDECTGMCGV